MRRGEYIYYKSGLADSFKGKNMGFMESYKYLDNLCKDINDIGITGYIKDIEQEPNGDFYVDGWEKIICSLSIIGIYGIRLPTKTMLTKVICVRSRIRHGWMSFISILLGKQVRLHCVRKRPDFIPRRNLLKQRRIQQFNMLHPLQN